ncbi:MAG: hypothetical protein AAFY26_24140 [Cyanobacteria bacterium J06638_22]
MLPAGTKITNQYNDIGLNIRSLRFGEDGVGVGPVDNPIIFDSTTPTGGDLDLKTTDQGNVLIISEDNILEEPDDNAFGVRIRVTSATVMSTSAPPLGQQ